MKKTLLSIVIAFIIMLGLLICSACVPRKSITKNMQASAALMCENPSYYFSTADFVHASKIDRYADSITLSIGYYLDEDHPLESTMWARYYGSFSNRQNQEFADSVNAELEPNQEYIRYWHGSSALMRVLHTFTSIKAIYVGNALLIAMLFLLLLAILWKRGNRRDAACLSLMLLAVSIWYVPLSLEYTWVFMVLPVAAISSIISKKESGKTLAGMMIVVGMVTNYLDFLTAETLTLTVPLLLSLRLTSQSKEGDEGEKKNRVVWKNVVESCAGWLIGYLGMWVSKWLLAGAILHIDVRPLITDHIAERLDGAVGHIPGRELIGQALLRNLKCLFPYEYGISGAVLVFLLIILFAFIPVIRGKVELRRKIDWNRIGAYLMIGSIPIVRLLVLHNHAYRHYFFSYRALGATILAILFVLLEMTETTNKTNGKVSGDREAGADRSNNPHAVSE